MCCCTSRLYYDVIVTFSKELTEIKRNKNSVDELFWEVLEQEKVAEEGRGKAKLSIRQFTEQSQ